MKNTWLALPIGLAVAGALGADDRKDLPVVLRVMTFNLWQGGEQGGQPLEQTARVIREARADIVGLQETNGQPRDGVRPDNSKRLADLLGWNQASQGNGGAVISRFKHLEVTPGRWGVKLEIAPGQAAYIFNVHLSHAPYQPYQLLSIPYEDGPFIKTEAEAIDFARKARGDQIAGLVSELKPAIATGLPVFVTGDFNEPSHLDWTSEAARAGKCPIAVAWPATRAVVDCGLSDAFRAVRPDVIKDRGNTWTPTTREDDPRDRHDRIDLVFVGGPQLVRQAQIVGEDSSRADLVVAPYPSDHRAVVVECTLGPEARLSRGYSIPVLDFSTRSDRQVVVDREPGQYLGHPTTVLLEDGRTMLAVYPRGHGRGAIVLKRSEDGGRTWSERLPTPASWATSQETPTIHRVVDGKGVKRLVLFSGLHPIRAAWSEDDGHTWSELRAIGDFGGIVAMGSVVEQRGGAGRYAAFFHDDGRYLSGGEKPASPGFTVYRTLSQDGGLTWSSPVGIASRADVHLCEPGAVRSPDGATLALLLRENSRRRNSFVIFSSDDARTWTLPRELPAALTGDRHVARYAPDGRLFITFRDTTLESSTRGDWVGWVGTYEDLVLGREGQYRVRFLKNHQAADCAYPGLELLPDGTFVTTTYGHWVAGEKPYIVSVRFRLDDLDALRRGKE